MLLCIMCTSILVLPSYFRIIGSKVTILHNEAGNEIHINYIMLQESDIKAYSPGTSIQCSTHTGVLIVN